MRNRELGQTRGDIGVADALLTEVTPDVLSGAAADGVKNGIAEPSGNGDMVVAQHSGGSGHGGGEDMVVVLRQMQADLQAMTQCLQAHLNDISQCLVALHRTSLTLQVAILEALLNVLIVTFLKHL